MGIETELPKTVHVIIDMLWENDEHSVSMDVHELLHYDLGN